MELDAPKSEFEREIATYRETMDSLHENAADHSATIDSLDGAMADLKASVAEMGDAVDEYDHALGEFDDAVASLQAHTTDDTRSRSASAAPPVAGD
jgi:chromosome segregation ATPase